MIDRLPVPTIAGPNTSTPPAAPTRAPAPAADAPAVWPSTARAPSDVEPLARLDIRHHVYPQARSFADALADARQHGDALLAHLGGELARALLERLSLPLGALGGLGMLQRLQRALPRPPPRPPQLGPRVDLAALPAPALDPPRPLPVGRRWTLGWGPSTRPEAELRHNAAVAEVLTRLARSTIAGEPGIVVESGARAIDDLDGCVDELLQTGHHIEATVVHRAADFSPLTYTDGDGRAWEVPIIVHFASPLRDERGRAVDMPATHAEIVFQIRGPLVNADVGWGNTERGVGFVPQGAAARTSWEPNQAITSLDGAAALRLAGKVTATIGAAAKRDGFLFDGYGPYGTCHTAVALVEMALTGRTSAWPLVFDHARVRQAVSDVPALAAAARRLPDDRGGELTADRLRRLAANFPWSPGQEPTTHLVRVREALDGALARPQPRV